jgi:hypothetical protein
MKSRLIGSAVGGRTQKLLAGVEEIQSVHGLLARLPSVVSHQPKSLEEWVVPKPSTHRTWSKVPSRAATAKTYSSSKRRVLIR